MNLPFFGNGKAEPTPENDPTSLGNLAIERGLCTSEDVKQAREAQDTRLGEVLVKSGKLTEEQRDELLIEQRRRRGEKIPADELHRFERSKFRSRVVSIADGFREASEDAQQLATSITACAKTAIEG